MANFNVKIIQFSEMGDVLFAADPSRLTVVRGDTITFIREDAGGRVGAPTLSGFISGVFTNTANVSLAANGSTAVKTVKTNATLGAMYLTVSSPDFTPFSFEVNVTSGLLTTPDNFNFDNVSLAQPGSTVESNQITVSGINVPVSVTMSAGQFMIGKDGIWRTSGTVSNNDKVRLRHIASVNYNTTLTVSCSIGTVTRTWSVTTPNDPGSGQIIDFPVTSLPIRLSEVVDFFGGKNIYASERPPNMRAYLKGAGLVPNIAKNIRVPTSGVLKLSDFVGSGTSLYFLRYPAFRYHGLDNLGGTVTVQVEWDYLLNVDVKNPVVGFGAIARACQYRYRIVESLNQGYTTGVNSSVANSVGSFSAWSDIPKLQLSAVIPATIERYFRGVVQFEVRSLYKPSVILQAEAGYELAGYGR